MTSPPKPKPKTKPSPAELETVELDSDAWPKFEALMKSAAKMGHKTHDKPIHAGKNKKVR